MKRILVCLSLLIASNLTNAAIIDGNRLLKMCEDPSSVLCLTYISGAIDMHSQMQELSPNKYDICFPEGVGLEQAARIVKKDLETFPEKLHYSGAGRILIALTYEFSCDSNAKDNDGSTEN